MFIKTIPALAFSAAVTVTMAACAGQAGSVRSVSSRTTTAPYALTGAAKAPSSGAIGWTRVKPAQFEPPTMHEE